MPRCPAGAMDEGPVDLRTRPKGISGAALPLRKRPLRPASPEPAAPRGPAGPLDALRSNCDVPAVPGPPHCVARPEALYYQGPLMPMYSTPTMAPPFPLLNLPTHPYSMICPVEHPLSADIAMATRVDEDGDTPLHIAVVQNNKTAVYRILSLFKLGNREVDVHNNLRQTPLHLAVITTLPDIVRLLVTAGASPMALDRHGQTAVHLACEHRSPSCLQALLDSATPGSVDLEARNYEGLTALHVAVNTGCQEAVLLLLERGADIDAVDIKSGRSPLIHAVENNSLNMVQLLLLVSSCLWFLPCLAPVRLSLPPLSWTPFSNSDPGYCSASDSDSSLQPLTCQFKFGWLVGWLAFEKGSYCIELTSMQSNSLCRPGWPLTQRSTCLCLPSAGINGVHHHHPALFFDCTWMFCLHISLCTRYLQCPLRPEESIRSPRTGITNTCKLQCECWNSNPVPLEGEPGLLTNEPSLSFKSTF
eukprot:XP_006228535.1 PREDICTED: B-cell lymphoma 3 protein isoform X1 [Rattus norvegicus]